MTISYAVDVSKADYLSLLRLMFRWKGSLWKNVYVELALWLILYSIIALLYHLGLHGENKRKYTRCSAGVSTPESSSFSGEHMNDVLAVYRSTK
uniref:Bestrophin homolog n=1 Tax=Ascaris lumbricoides TaxID=6252 RepID=A0A0M3HK37_ASCLU